MVFGRGTLELAVALQMIELDAVLLDPDVGERAAQRKPYLSQVERFRVVTCVHDLIHRRATWPVVQMELIFRHGCPQGTAHETGIAYRTASE